MTSMLLGACFAAGYIYARLRKDEYLRRFFHQRYFNFITVFDRAADWGDQVTGRWYERTANFDSVYDLWFYRASKRAAKAARRNLAP